MNESKKMALLAVEALEDKKAEDITIIDISEVSVLADYFIIADGSNRNQVQAMADSAEEALGRAGYDAKQIEGYQSANWILMDYKDIIVHVFSKEDRAFYDLERIWRDGNRLVKKIYSRIKKSSQDRYFCRVDVLGTLFLLLPLYNISDYEEEVMKFIVLLKYAI